MARAEPHTPIEISIVAYSRRDLDSFFGRGPSRETPCMSAQAREAASKMSKAKRATRRPAQT